MCTHVCTHVGAELARQAVLQSSALCQPGPGAWHVAHLWQPVCWLALRQGLGPYCVAPPVMLGTLSHGGAHVGGWEHGSCQWYASDLRPLQATPPVITAPGLVIDMGGLCCAGTPALLLGLPPQPLVLPQEALALSMPSRGGGELSPPPAPAHTAGLRGAVRPGGEPPPTGGFLPPRRWCVCVWNSCV